MAHYLVTGGAGFIGSHLAEELVRRGERVRVVDSLITGKRENLAHLPQRRVHRGRPRRPRRRARARSHGVDYVLHQAAIPSVPRSVEDPITSNRANIDASLNVLVAARDAGVKRVVYAGSSSAYGNTPTLPKVETMPTAPLSPYALQKLVAEQYCQMFTQLYGLETVTIRYFNVFGPRQDPSSPYSGVISLFISALVRGPARRRSTATASRRATSPTSPTSSTACCAPATAPSASGEVINVATGGRISLNELFRTVRDLIGAHGRADLRRAARRRRPRLAGRHHARRSALLGYEPIVTFEEGLEQTVAWYRASQVPVA